MGQCGRAYALSKGKRRVPAALVKDSAFPFKPGGPFPDGNNTLQALAHRHGQHRRTLEPKDAVDLQLERLPYKNASIRIRKE